MGKVVIKAENISKQYRLGLVGTGTVKDDFKRWWHNVRGKEDPFLKIGEANNRAVKGESDYVWSLRDINFEINQGDSVGIIGRNGAGKSTLLKILSQVTQPTTGKIYTKGRIASLLEVGTGFHPEMTGRENIYLNGAILGMRKHEITRKLDEIIAFSGVERYIDTPVKRYSSGMYVRLAFAVAAHLESEILIVDEVLAVGDAEFQKKCLGKMNDVSKGEGRTVLFVSHNMAAVKSLCNKGLLLSNGENVAGLNSIEQTISNYLKSGNNDFANHWRGNLLTTDGVLELQKVGIEYAEDIQITNYTNNMPLELSFQYDILSQHHNKYRLIFSITTLDDVILFSSGISIKQFEIGSYVSKVIIPSLTLNSNSYKVIARVDIPYVAYCIPEQEFIRFDISEIEKHSYGVLDSNEPKGYFHLPLSYENLKI